MPWKDKGQKRAYDREYRARPEVKARTKAYMACWTEKNKKRRNDAEQRRRRSRRGQLLVSTAKTRARRRSMEFDLDQYVDAIQARVDAGYCELTGWPFNLDGGRTFDSPSIDRIDPTKGYTHDNIRVVLNLVNAALGDWGEETLKEVMKKWLS